jgi:geranylgeranyl reductase family protein
VLERRRFPRPKPCGGGLSGRAMRWLDVPLPADLIDCEVYAGRSHFGPVTINARQDRRVAILVTRSRFDHFLLEKAREAGAHVEWREVRSIDVRREGVVLATPEGEVSARCAIVCEGANRRLTNALRGRENPKHIGFCLEAEIPVADPDPYADLRDSMDIYFGAPSHGYGWIFHHGSYYSVGIGGLCHWFRSPLETFRKFLADRGFAPDGVRPRGHFLPCGGTSRIVHAERVILAGDAAGWVDPFQGEGIGYAIRSGQLAAETVLDAAKGNDFSRRALAGYKRRCDEEFGRDLRAASIVMHVVYWWPQILSWAPRSTERVLGEYLKVTAGDLSYREFVRWIACRMPRFLLRAPWRRECGTVAAATVGSAAGHPPVERPRLDKPAVPQPMEKRTRD